MDYRYHKIATRADRSNYLVQSFEDIFQSANSVLDVGSSAGALKQALGPKVTDLDADESVVSDDVVATPDYTIDLEKELLSAFSDRQFDVIVCSDVLEHLNNLHAVLDDMVRVANRHIIITLPNCTNTWRALKILFRQTAGRQWGLPYNRVADRHKWFFSWREIDQFFNTYCEHNQVSEHQKFLLFNNDTSKLRGQVISSLMKIFPIPSFSETYYLVLVKQ